MLKKNHFFYRTIVEIITYAAYPCTLSTILFEKASKNPVSLSHDVSHTITSGQRSTTQRHQ